MKKIAVVTGTRAEYGLLKPLINKISEDPELELQLIVTGMHLSPKFGNTFKEIEKDGFFINRKIKDNLTGDLAIDITKSIATVMSGFAEALEELLPDVIVVLGDRSEILGVVTAALIKGVPVAHLHGGETTEGAYDEAIRHAITKMSYLHFTSTEAYKNRVIQLGESPERVFNVGAIALDSVKTLNLLDRGDFETSIDFQLKSKNVLITFHPVTLENSSAGKQFEELLISLDKLDDTLLIFTKPNSDKGGNIIIEMIDDYVDKNPDKSICFDSLGQLRYLSALQYVDVVVGNSSSGVYEVPMFKKPTINIGDRQKGRLMPKSVINCNTNNIEITNAINKVFETTFTDEIQGLENLYGNGTASSQIIKILKTKKISSTKKQFHNL